MEKEISASLARRLAEAADGFRNINKVYFIAGYDRPHRRKDFPDLESAQTYYSDLKDKHLYGIFGPYKTTDELKELNLAGVESIDSIVMNIHYKNTTTQVVTLPGKIDSIFFNLSSFEKFVFPYYSKLFGVEYAKKLRDNLIVKYTNNTPAGGVLVIPRFMPTITQGLYQGSGAYEEGELLP
jgi:hypothetical protein